MLPTEIIDNAQNYLADKGVYRTNTFLLDVFNDGYKLAAVLTLFDERRGSFSQSSTRNMISTPGSGRLIAPLYVANTATGKRVQPVRIQDFEFYSSTWEGTVGGADIDYYTVLAPYHPAEIEMWCVPMVNDGTTDVTVVGAYVPVDATLSDELRMPENFQDILFWYTVFGGFVSEPGMGEDAGRAYEQFVRRINELTERMKSRFPGGQGFRPRPVEFPYDIVTRQQQKGTEKREDQDAS
jgi:hypothetical protein